MRDISSRLRLLALTLAALCTSNLFAATTWSGSVSLTSDLNETDELIVESGAAVDLNGHSVTLNGKLTVQGAATITNSDTGDCKDVTLYCSNDLESQFQNLTFFGNLKLTVGGKTKTNVGFQGVTNTHTGGTVLDGYGISSSAQKPRYSLAGAFGGTSLTIKNGSRIMQKGSSIDLGLTDIYFEGVDTSSLLQSGSNVTYPSTMKIHAASGNRANIGAEAGQTYLKCDVSDVKGILSLHGGSQQNHIQTSLKDTTLEMNSDTKIRCTSGYVTDDLFEIGALQTHPDITEYQSNAQIHNGADNKTVTLKIGGLGTDATFYGNITGNSASTKNIRVEKVGAGIWTVGGTNSYYGGTTISDGAIKLVNAARLGSSGNITFNGGELVIGANGIEDLSSRFTTNGTATATAKIGVDEDVAYTIAGNLSKCDDFEKTRAGTLILSSSLAHSGDTTVSGGTLVVQPGASLGTGALSIANGAKVLVDASAAEWDNGDTVSLFTVGSLDAGTTLSADNIGLYNEGRKISIGDITLDGTTVKATVTKKTLLWNGGSGTWDTTTANWVNKADTTEALVYADGDKVEFAGDSEYTVTISSDVTPAQLTIDPVAGGNVIFAGAGVINMSSITMSGAGKVTLGNGKNPFTTIDVTAGTLALGVDQPVSIDNASLYVEGDAVLDLNGHSLMVGFAGKRASDGNSAIVTNSQDEVRGILTVGVGNNWPDFNNWATLSGNMNYIVTGNKQKHFRDSSSTRPVNTISGMLAVSNQTGDCRIYGAIDTGTADIGFLGNSKLYIPSSNLSGLDGFQGIHVEGEGNRFKIEGWSGGTTIKFNGALTGDGELLIENGFRPSIHLDGDSSQFEGTLYLKYAPSDATTWRGIFFERANNLDTVDGTASLEKATVIMTNDTSSALNKLWIAGGRYHGSIDTFPIGDLTTGSADPEMYTNSTLRTYKDGVILEVGALGKSGTFAASIQQYENASYQTSLVKVGAGTWTLTGTNHVYGGTTTVKGGRLNIDSAEFTAGTAIIVTNAVLGGTGTIKVPITVKKDGTLAGSFAATAGVTFEAGSIVEVAAGAANVPNISSAVNASTLTVKLTGELNTANEYTILTAGSDSTGTASVVVDDGALGWSANWVDGDGDTKVLQASYTTPKIDVDDKEVGYVDGKTAVITNTAAESITLPASGLTAVSVAINSASGQAALVSSGLTLTTDNVTVYATDASGNKTTTDITGAFKVTEDGTTYTITLDETATVNDVKVKPELNTEDKQPMSIADGSVGLAVKTIPGLWYAMESCDTPAGSYGVVETSIKQADNSGTTSLSCAMEQEATVKFYKVVTGASKASLTTTNN